jgi:hypothetical protein
VVASPANAPAVAAGTTLVIVATPDVQNLNCPTAPAANVQMIVPVPAREVIASVNTIAPAAVIAAILENASGAGIDMKTELTVTFWFEGFELGLSTMWNRSADAKAEFSVRAVIFLSAIFFL